LGQGKEKRKGARGREKDLGRRWPTWGGERRERAGPRGEERGKKGKGRPKGFGSPFLLFFFFSTFKPFKQIYMNSNKFEFKPYKLNTNKTMRQYECTSKLIL
jgi:hypothetical protein